MSWETRTLFDELAPDAGARCKPTPVVTVPAAPKPIASHQPGAADCAVLGRNVSAMAAVVRVMELAAKTEIEATAGLPAP